MTESDGTTGRPERSVAATLGAAAVGAASIWLGALVTVHMEPVPTTLQTLAVLVVGGLGGPRVGFAAGAIYLMAVLLGAPILADGNSAPGAAFLDLKSGGYVVAFGFAGAMAGTAPPRFFGTILRFLGAHALILAVGGTWLAVHIGLGPAVEHGVKPFLLGALAKSVAAAVIVRAVRRH